MLMKGRIRSVSNERQQGKTNSKKGGRKRVWRQPEEEAKIEAHGEKPIGSVNKARAMPGGRLFYRAATNREKHSVHEALWQAILLPEQVSQAI